MLLTIKIGNKKFTASGLTAGLTREAFQINRDALDLARVGTAIQSAADEKDYDKVAEILDKTLEIRDRKSTLICKVYGDKFTVDELEYALTDAQIDEQMNGIMAGINRTIAKN